MVKEIVIQTMQRYADENRILCLQVKNQIALGLSIFAVHKDKKESCLIKVNNFAGIVKAPIFLVMKNIGA